MLKTSTCGRLAQLVEHCDHTAGVTGSSPVAPTPIAVCELHPANFVLMFHFTRDAYYVVPIVLPLAEISLAFSL